MEILYRLIYNFQKCFLVFWFLIIECSFFIWITILLIIIIWIKSISSIFLKISILLISVVPLIYLLIILIFTKSIILSNLLETIIYFWIILKRLNILIIHHLIPRLIIILSVNLLIVLGSTEVFKIKIMFFQKLVFLFIFLATLWLILIWKIKVHLFLNFLRFFVFSDFLIGVRWSLWLLWYFFVSVLVYLLFI